MAVGGCGDVLTGMIAGLLSQGMSPFDAACAGTYLHGRAGDLAKEKLTEYGMLATDVINHIGEAMKLADRRRL